MSALLLGSISTVIDTSELQREAFNDAFAQHGLGWTWSRETYRDLLDSNGGRDRVAAYAAERGEEVDAEAVHATKSELFRAALATVRPSPRPGVVETIARAREAGMRVGLVTTTSADNVAAVLAALGDEVAFDLTVDAGDVEQPKPDPAAYLFALEELGEPAEQCVAVEDNPGGAEAAGAAGLACIAFPNDNTDHLDFRGVRTSLDKLDLDVVTALLDRS